MNRLRRIHWIVAGVLVLAAVSNGSLHAQTSDAVSVVTRYYDAMRQGDLAAALKLVDGPGADEPLLQTFRNWAAGSPWGMRRLSSVQQCKSNLKNIGTACEMYATDHSGRYPHQLRELMPNYLTDIPTCPDAGRDSYSPSFRSAVTPDAYTVFCSGNNHAKQGLAADSPAYTSTSGLLVEAVRPDNSVPALQWRVHAVTVISREESGDHAAVKVDETYLLQDMPTHVLATYPLHRTAGGWKIDGVALARTLDASALMTRVIERRRDPARRGPVMLPLSQWLRLNGVGLSLAAVKGLADLPDLRVGLLTGCKTNLKNLGTACEMYCVDHSGHYPARLSELVPHYLEELPACPAARHDTYSATFQSVANPDVYTIACGGRNHDLEGIETDFPQYTSSEGLLERKY